MKRRFQTIDEDKIVDSIASNWNEEDQSELFCEIQAITLQNLQNKNKSNHK